MKLKTNMKTICIDIDGTISHFIEWQGSDKFGNVLSGAVENISKLKEAGYFIIIYTTRSDKEDIKNFLDRNNIPFDAINENPYQPQNAIGGKPMADVYLDDRNVSFNGDWNKAYNDVITFRTWEKQEEDECMKDYQKQFMSDDFNQSMEMLRHYDNNNWEITKLAVSEMLLAIVACWTIYSLHLSLSISNQILPKERLFVVFGTICLLSFFFGILSQYLIGRNRIYFAKTARHINNYRQHALKNNPFGFVNDYWCNSTYPKTSSLKSTQFMCGFLLNIFTSIMFAASILLFMLSNGCLCVWVPSFLGFLSFISSLFLAKLILEKF